MAGLEWKLRAHDGIPGMAWLAECTQKGIALHHGRWVEADGSKLVEGAWAGAFQGDPSSAATVAGSAAVRRGNGVVFVSPSHTLEGLYYHEEPTGLTISNSLAFLLAALGTEVSYDPHLGARFASAVAGIAHYRRDVLSTDRGMVLRLLHENGFWRPGGKLQAERKPDRFEFPDFQSYRNALSAEIAAVLANAADPARQHPFRPLGTCSSGYDSPTCLALARPLGCRSAVTLASARGGDDDSGQEVAQALGVELQSFARNEDVTDAEVREFMATGMGGEDVVFATFEQALPRSVLLTGFHGDKIWSTNAKPNAVLSRGDVSGSSMGEFRLRTGFVHLPVPFIGGLHHPEINAISNSAEMTPWSIGGWYDRPIPRRIVEEAGVPRHAFGQAKKAASLMIFMAPHLQPRAIRDEAGRLRSGLGQRQRLALRLRERSYVARLAASRLLEKAGKLNAPARWAAHKIRDVVAGDSRMFEHDTAGAFFEFQVSMSSVAQHYREAVQAKRASSSSA